MSYSWIHSVLVILRYQNLFLFNNLKGICKKSRWLNSSMFRYMQQPRQGHIWLWVTRCFQNKPAKSSGTSRIGRDRKRSEVSILKNSREFSNYFGSHFIYFYSRCLTFMAQREIWFKIERDRELWILRVSENSRIVSILGVSLKSKTGEYFKS